jgi:TatD DNase family protein
MTNSRTIAGYDFHCHVDLHKDPISLIADCERRRIFTLAVTTTPKAWPQNRKWTASCRYVRAAVGLHPELAGGRHRETDLLKLCMRETAYVGEIGLDGSPPHRESLPIQRRVFGAILDEAARLGGKILTIHSRRAAAEVIDQIGQRAAPGHVISILHWFSGTENELLAGVAAGCMFSINPAMAASKGGRVIIETLPLDRLLTETDAPFAEIAGRRTHSADVMDLVGQIARIRRQEEDEVRAAIAQNAARLFAFAALGAGAWKDMS